MEQTPRTPTPALLDVLVPPVGLGFDVVELEELILAVDDRLEYAGADSRATLRGIRAELEHSLGRLIARS